MEDQDEKPVTKQYNEKQIKLTLKRQGTLYAMYISIDGETKNKAVQFNTEDDMYGFNWSALIGMVDKYCKE